MVRRDSEKLSGVMTQWVSARAATFVRPAYERSAASLVSKAVASRSASGAKGCAAVVELFISALFFLRAAQPACGVSP